MTKMFVKWKNTFCFDWFFLRIIIIVWKISEPFFKHFLVEVKKETQFFTILWQFTAEILYSQIYLQKLLKETMILHQHSCSHELNRKPVDSGWISWKRSLKFSSESVTTWSSSFPGLYAGALRQTEKSGKYWTYRLMNPSRLIIEMIIQNWFRRCNSYCLLSG